VAGADIGVLLRRHRRLAGLTMEALAEASGVSTRAISEMERGRARGPQARTVAALATALSLDGPAREELLTAARDGRLRRLPDLPELCALPPDLPDFVGRDAELTELDRLADRTTRPRLVVVSGAGGLGKSALATHAAHRLGPAFPGGVLHLDLRGLDPRPLDPSVALGRVLQSLGVRVVPTELADRSALCRQLLAEREALVVLDNARAEAQVRPLLIGEGGSTVLVTSRRMLSGLSHARRLALTPLPDPDAVALLADVEGVGSDDGALAEVARLCGNYPLALRVVRNLLITRPSWTLADLVGRLADRDQRIDRLRAGDLEVDAALGLSYEQLDDGTRRLFRRLSLVHAGAGAEAAAVLAEVDVREAEQLLDDLVELNLLVPLPGGRVGFHDLVTVYAGARLAEEETPAERTAAADRLRAWVLATSGTAGRLFEPDAPADASFSGGLTFPDLAAAERWLRLEEGNWVAALGEAAAAGDDRIVVDVAEAMHWFSDRWYAWPSWVTVFGWSSEGAHRLGDDRLEAVHRNYLAWALMMQRRAAESVASAELAGRLARSAGDLAQEAWSHTYLAETYRLIEDGPVALEHYRSAVAVFDRLGDGVSSLTPQIGRGVLLNQLGRHDEAVLAFNDALARLDDDRVELPDHIRDWHRQDVLDGLGNARRGSGDLAGAESALRAAVEVATRLGVAVAHGDSQRSLARVLRAQGRLDEARSAFVAARAAFEQAGGTSRVTAVDAELAALDREADPDHRGGPPAATGQQT
jgi:transcriptional regulator with XRE-family HTH domain/tetratricopeptide (TPR) repeat protein